MLEESKAIVRRLIEDHWNGKNLAAGERVLRSDCVATDA
jgi:hypothetical protein